MFQTYTFWSKSNQNKTNSQLFQVWLLPSHAHIHALIYINTHTDIHTHTQKFKQYTDFQRLWLFRFSASFHTSNRELTAVYENDTKPFFFFVHCSSVQQWKSAAWANYQGPVQMISSPATVCIITVLFSECSAERVLKRRQLWGKLALWLVILWQ